MSTASCPHFAKYDQQIKAAARTVTSGNRPVELTACEYGLVEFFALHRAAVVTRTKLYENLFDEDGNTLSNLLDVHVSNVRKKLGATSSRPGGVTGIASKPDHVFQSFRWRLQLCHGLILLAVLAGFGFTACRLQYGNELHRVDQELQQHLGLLLEEWSRPRPVVRRTPQA